MARHETIVFLGGGRITSAMIEGLRRARVQHKISVYDRNARKPAALRRKFRVQVETDLLRAIDKASLLILAVQPGSIKQLLEKAGSIERSLLAISLAAGIPLARLRGRLGANVHWARAMPSPACSSGRGLAAIVFDRKISRDARRRARALLRSLGQVIELSEKQFDVFTATYSVSHGYHALAALSSAAIKLGLAPRIAEIAAAHALADGVIAWRERRVPLDSLLQEAVTAGGIAAAVLKSEESAEYSRIIEQGLREGAARARSFRKLL